MSVIETISAAVTRTGDVLIGASLDAPRVGSSTDQRGVDVAGWVLGRSTPAVAVEFVADGEVFRRVPLTVRRDDVTRAFPAAPCEHPCGFSAQVCVAGIRDLAFEVHAVLADQTRHPVASVHLRRRWPEDATPDHTPLVSVIIPCFRQAAYLGDAIRSVCAQTYPHCEIVVIDDGSPDNTAAVARQFPGVRLVRQPNMGLANARNTGIRESSGDFLVFLDADDRLRPTAIAAGLSAFRDRPDAAFVFGRHVYIAFDGSPIETPEYEFNGGADGFEALLGTEYIECLSTVLFRRSVLHEAGGFASGAGGCTDLDLYLRIARRHPIQHHQQVVMEYRRHGTNMSGDAAFTFKHTLPVFRSHWKHAKRSAEYRAAFARGLRFRKQWGREELVRTVTASLLARAPGAFHDLRQLLRWHPLGAVRVAWRVALQSRDLRVMRRPATDVSTGD